MGGVVGTTPKSPKKFRKIRPLFWDVNTIEILFLGLKKILEWKPYSLKSLLSFFHSSVHHTNPDKVSFDLIVLSPPFKKAFPHLQFSPCFFTWFFRSWAMRAFPRHRTTNLWTMPHTTRRLWYSFYDKTQWLPFLSLHTADVWTRLESFSKRIIAPSLFLGFGFVVYERRP